MRTQQLIHRIVAVLVTISVAAGLVGCNKNEPAADPSAPASNPGAKNTKVNPETGDRG